MTNEASKKTASTAAVAAADQQAAKQKPKIIHGKISEIQSMEINYLKPIALLIGVVVALIASGRLIASHFEKKYGLQNLCDCPCHKACHCNCQKKSDQ